MGEHWPSFVSLDYVHCYARAFPQRRLSVITVDDIKGMSAAFYVHDKVGESILPTVPWESGAALGLTEARLEVLRSKLNVELLWFPLIYLDMAGTRELAALCSATVSSRRASPIIKLSANTEEVWSRARANLGRRADRRRRAFERLGLVCQHVQDPDLAIQFVAQIERSSWKATCGQDMFSRDQFSLYSSLLSHGVLLAIIVFDDGRPVAYRLDGRNGNTIFCVKWSYDETYARVSPGFYLIAIDLAQRYHANGITLIDLFGGSDSLKKSVMTGNRRRVDIAWPNGQLANELISRGLQHDALVENHVKTGRGLRYLYDNE
jgi:CelD/BcsL family acetyltransferase involved in cellulose biosynthesis